MKYSIDKHIQVFATWTAARAVQRAFTTTIKIMAAIDKTELVRFSKLNIRTPEDFEDFHRKCANKIMLALKKEKCSYGRASKIIAVYLKTSVIIPLNGNGKLCTLIHCPIDRILLANIAKKQKLNHLKIIVWTKLKEEEYWKLIEELRSIDLAPNWKLEKYWELN